MTFLFSTFFLVVPDATGDGAGNSLINAFGVAVDSSGNVYVTGQSSGNAFKITTPGTGVGDSSPIFSRSDDTQSVN